MNPEFEHTPLYTENSEKSVLCIGSVSEERYNSMVALGTLLKQYRDRLRSLYHILTAEGYDTYLFTAWGWFEIISAGTLQAAKPELMKCYGLERVFSMEIYGSSRPFVESVPAEGYFDCIIEPQAEDEFLTTDDLFDGILADVSAVVYDNADRDPFTQTILDKAASLGKRMIDINTAI